MQYQLFSPVIVHDPARRRFPLLVRTVLGLIDANDFLQLSTSDRLLQFLATALHRAEELSDDVPAAIERTL